GSSPRVKSGSDPDKFTAGLKRAEAADDALGALGPALVAQRPGRRPDVDTVAHDDVAALQFARRAVAEFRVHVIVERGITGHPRAAHRRALVARALEVGLARGEHRLRAAQGLGDTAAQRDDDDLYFSLA